MVDQMTNHGTQIDRFLFPRVGGLKWPDDIYIYSISSTHIFLFHVFGFVDFVQWFSFHLFILCILFIMYFIYYVSYSLCILFIMYFIHYVFYSISVLFIMYFIHYAFYMIPNILFLMNKPMNARSINNNIVLFFSFHNGNSGSLNYNIQ